MSRDPFGTSFGTDRLAKIKQPLTEDQKTKIRKMRHEVRKIRQELEEEKKLRLASLSEPASGFGDYQQARFAVPENPVMRLGQEKPRQVDSLAEQQMNIELDNRNAEFAKLRERIESQLEVQPVPVFVPVVAQPIRASTPTAAIASVPRGSIVRLMANTVRQIVRAARSKSNVPPHQYLPNVPAPDVLHEVIYGKSHN